jgi:hypothetical protein
MDVREATAELEPATGTVVQVFTTGTMVQVFLLSGKVPFESFSAANGTSNGVIALPELNKQI